MQEGQPDASSTPQKQRPRRKRRRRGRSRGGGQGQDTAALHQRSASHFRNDDQQRGAKYFAQGRVHLEHKAERATARVEGNERPLYSVGIDWSRVAGERRLHVFCECERFAGGTPCKHIWATLLELEKTPGIKSPKGKERLGLRKDRAASWKELGVSPPPDGERAARRSRVRTVRAQKARRGRRRSNVTSWRDHLQQVQDRISSLGASNGHRKSKAASTEIQLFLNTAASASGDGLLLDLFGRRLNSAGEPGKLKRANVDLEGILGLLSRPSDESDEASDVTVIAALPADAPRAQSRARRSKGKAHNTTCQRLRLPVQLVESTIPRLCDAGILRQWDGRRIGDPKPLQWDEGPAFDLTLNLEFAAARRMRLRGVLEREDETIALTKVLLVVPLPLDGVAERAIVVLQERVVQLELRGGEDLPWITLLRDQGDLLIPEDDLEEAVTSLLEMPSLPQLRAPEELQLTKEESPPCPRLVLEPEDTPEWMNPQLVAQLSFVYGAIPIEASELKPAVIDWDERRFVRRDMEAENEALVRLLELGFRPAPSSKGDGLELDPRQLPAVAEPLLLDGWEVEAHGTSIRPPSPPALRVESGLDWFELSGQVEFAGDQVDFSKILEAISRGDRTVELDDGSKGLLPESWMETYDSLAQLAQSSSDAGLRFLPSQALLVDALMAAMPPINVDAAFAELREKLRTFESITPKKEPRGFGGTLRGYQRLGLGWLCFLREFGLGGVLADDMGLGKTVQALALMRTYRTSKKTSGRPFLVVAPRSLVYNWIDEAERFTPNFKVVEYSGPDREALKAKLGNYDLVVTTYGTMRRDIGYLATVDFDTIILDEAQAIKNPDSQTAKASRLLVADNRLALTGTPIENHLGELGSIFEFLNPGLLGRLPALDVLAGGRAPSQEELALVSKGIRPFILRRTKSEVLPDLPEKTEQVLRCSLGEEQQEVYDQLRAVYRDSLLQQVETEGMSGSTMQVLEALLRLRQVACHPGLVSEEWGDRGSAKLEALFERVSEIRTEGQKVVIFSQFTKLLGFVRRELDERNQVYAYLDGQTKNRGEVVERFQTDPDCNLFLISLKAGGVGLNLTAASYVFLLDPWWNPAVEAQAIDRAHRIGQTQKVFAYRLIAQDTVEEKMVELQRSKRQLADAILEGEGTTLSDLTADDLRMLLS